MAETTGLTGYAADFMGIANSYAEIWNQPDPVLRRTAIANLWAADGVGYLEGVRFSGHDELDTRVTDIYGKFGASGKYRVRHAGDTSVHQDVIMFTIEVVTLDTDEIAWAGRVFLILDGDGRIREDYQVTVQFAVELLPIGESPA
ncbi:hypothetical protein [Nocardia vinacea]|uniref:hypothetical protein n=1 Tax=Nocardia vinacea TaxID=96468 RepID=UPI00030F3FE9|nr:hypothetical protein [Nocardia vinacea]